MKTSDKKIKVWTLRITDNDKSMLQDLALREKADFAIGYILGRLFEDGETEDVEVS